MEPTVLIIGAGPAGLAAARALRERGVQGVMVIDRDDGVGGLPRFCAHPGFGWEYTRRIESGPAFARRLRRDAQGVTVRTATTALRLEEGLSVEVVGPDLGHARLSPRAVLLTTGIRETPRPARLVPGARPERGVLTTGQLQQLVARGVPLPFERQVIVGSEHVSFSAILTARSAGIRTAAMIDSGDRVASFGMLAWLARRGFGIPILCNAVLEDIEGDDLVRGVAVCSGGRRTAIACDVVVFTGGWRPESVLARDGGLAIDARTNGPIIDQMMRTTLPGVFAAGNVLRGVESSGVAALEGARAGACIGAYLDGRLSGQIGDLEISVLHPLSFVVPQRWSHELPVAGAAALRASVRVKETVPDGAVMLRSGGMLWPLGPRGTLRRERRIPVALAKALAGAGPECAEVTLEVLSRQGRLIE